MSRTSCTSAVAGDGEAVRMEFGCGWMAAEVAVAVVILVLLLSEL